MSVTETDKQLNEFLKGKPGQALYLYDVFVRQFETEGRITLHPAKTMIGISNGRRRIAWVTQFGKGFLHVVFPFRQAYPDNLCFQKIAQVPGDAHQFNHHLRLLAESDINEEVLTYMRLAYSGE